MEAVFTGRGCCHCSFPRAPRRRAVQEPSVQSRAVLPLVKELSAPTLNINACPPRLLNSPQTQAFPSGGQLLREGRAERKRPSHVVEAAPGDSTARWWEKEGGPNVRDVHSIGDFVEELAGAGDNLVVVEFYASWCGSCRALLPKFLKIAAEHPDITFLKVNFDECKAMCKSLNIKVLPFFHFYRGADGRLDAFSASIAKLAKLREAIEIHNTARCSLGPAVGVGQDFDWEAAAKSNAAAAAAAKAAAAH